MTAGGDREETRLLRHRLIGAGFSHRGHSPEALPPQEAAPLARPAPVPGPPAGRQPQRGPLEGRMGHAEAGSGACDAASAQGAAAPALIATDLAASEEAEGAEAAEGAETRRGRASSFCASLSMPSSSAASSATEPNAEPGPGPIEEEPMVNVVKYTFRPRPPQQNFRDGRPCQQHYSRCKTLVKEGERSQVLRANPLDEPDIRAALVENMGWPDKALPPSRARLFAPLETDPWLPPEEEPVRVPVRVLPVSWPQQVYDSQFTQRGGYLRVLVSDLLSGW